ncbi:Thymidylate kinase [Candidatus Arsenophonus lipoptenae]|uniref:Thymidylate kinase n=1 Tax=Candidatus Arsenophonus lipoptenae TaxID=634113 RepID=A0A0X9VYC1_9GAMM|nr:dTMP kinase [Candidatus Arsenophonus lipoptenae]AMA64670.1 Thymidylate kinase [Candidatus Arsenophonus lipoptenae]
MNGRYIVIEGLEGSGKTTAVKTVAKILNNFGITKINFTREPGGTALAEQLRQLIKHSISKEKITSKAELLMLYAARIQLIENFIKPNLTKGKWIISDRNDLSSHAYQGGGRKICQKLIKILQNNIINNFKPDLIIYLDIEPELGLNRIKNRSKLDQIEKESLDFFKRTRKRYIELSNKDDTIITIDASNSLINVQENVNCVISNWLILQGYQRQENELVSMAKSSI